MGSVRFCHPPEPTNAAKSHGHLDEAAAEGRGNRGTAGQAAHQNFGEIAITAGD
jgi:hypothetical protein